MHIPYRILFGSGIFSRRGKKKRERESKRKKKKRKSWKRGQRHGQRERGVPRERPQKNGGRRAWHREEVGGGRLVGTAKRRAALHRSLPRKISTRKKPGLLKPLCLSHPPEPEPATSQQSKICSSRAFFFSSMFSSFFFCNFCPLASSRSSH